MFPKVFGSVNSGSGLNQGIDFFMQQAGNFDDLVAQYGDSISKSALDDRQYNAMREDTQYQRLVQDLEKAGLNKWLAVNGSASPSSQMVSSTSEAMSRAGELGQKYYALFEKTIDDLLDTGNKSWKNMNDLVETILKAGLSFI